MTGSRALMGFIAGFAMFVGSISGMSTGILWAADPGHDEPTASQANAGYLENINLSSPMAGKERVTVAVSRLVGAQVESQTAGVVLVKLDNIFVPQDLRRSFGEGSLRHVLRVVPKHEIVGGRPQTSIAIELRSSVPYSVRQEGRNILIDFNVAVGRAEKNAVASTPPVAASKVEVVETAAVPAEKPLVSEPVGDAGRAVVPPISIDFQDAGIKSVLRLLSELAKVNIVSGDDVKGNVTIRMKDVPWEQALDTILAITGLAKRQAGNVITVMTMEQLKKVEAEQARPSAEPFITRVVNVRYADAKKLTENLLELLPKDKEGKVLGSVKVDEHSNALIIQATRQEMTRLFPIIEKIDKPIPQILIKANIVETTKDTARNLGIQWGGINGQKIGNQSLYITPGGGAGSATNPGGPFAGAFKPTSGLTGIAGQGFGVNFPAAVTGSASASLGLIFGTIGENILEVQLSALQKDGKLNILSSPSITTLDNQKAFTENGQKIPYVTTEASGGVLTKSVKFENAVLRLEITPHVVDGKNLKMKIMVQKDEVDTSRSVDNNPFITKKQTETNLIVADGDTIVISGLTKQTKAETVNGVPWLKDIPVFGWLFKGESKSDLMEEVLIFITPTIIKPETVAGIQQGGPEELQLLKEKAL